MDRQAPTLPRISTGSDGLDDVLNGGLIANCLYLIDGDPGSGKTTLGIQFLLEGKKRGETGLYVTLSETRQELVRVAESHGWDLSGIAIHELVPSEESINGDSQYKMFHPSEVELAETTKRILVEVDKLNPSRVVFDSLSELRLLAQSPLRYRRQILALKQFFVGRNCTVMLLDDRTGDAADLQPQSVAHGVITLYQLAPEYGAERRRLRVTKMRGVPFRGGYHDFVIRKGGLEIFPRLVASEHKVVFKDEQMQSGLSEVDRLLGGGIDRGTSALIIGPAGSGKSSLAAQYLLAAAERGEKGIIITFDESERMIRRRLKSIGRPVDKHVEEGRIIIKQIDPAEVSPGEFIQALRGAAVTDGVKVVVIDSLNGYVNAMPEERFLTIQLHELLTFLGQRGIVTLMVVAQTGLMGAGMKAPGDSSYLADTVILLRYFETRGEVRKAISVVKKRGGAHENTIRELKIDAKGIHVGEPLRNFHGVLTGVPMAIDGQAVLEEKKN